MQKIAEESIVAANVLLADSSFVMYIEVIKTALISQKMYILSLRALTSRSVNEHKKPIVSTLLPLMVKRNERLKHLILM